MKHDFNKLKNIGHKTYQLKAVFNQILYFMIELIMLNFALLVAKATNKIFWVLVLQQVQTFLKY